MKLLPEEMPAEETASSEAVSVFDTVTNNEFLNAVKRLVYGVDSVLSDLPELWSEERREILENLTEVKELWPNKEDV